MARTSTRLAVIKNHKNSKFALELALMIFFTDTLEYFAQQDEQPEVIDPAEIAE